MNHDSLVARFALRNKAVILFLSVALCLGGAYAAFHIPSSVFPRTDFPRVVILVDNDVMPADEAQLGQVEPFLGGQFATQPLLDQAGQRGVVVGRAPRSISAADPDRRIGDLLDPQRHAGTDRDLLDMHVRSVKKRGGRPDLALGSKIRIHNHTLPLR
jgi:hypothetical protein